MQRITKRASAAFPAEKGERFTVRDGAGRPVERWQVVNVEEGKTAKYVTYDVSGYRSASDL